MSSITILEECQRTRLTENWFVHLEVQSRIITEQFRWIKVVRNGKKLFGHGNLTVDGIRYEIGIEYFLSTQLRMDRINILNHNIEYNDKIHVYNDLSLCLYHPLIDKPPNYWMPLHTMIPWISEWCHWYNEWKKYGVWLGKEILH